MKLAIFSPAFDTAGTLPKLIGEFDDVAVTLGTPGQRSQCPCWHVGKIFAEIVDLSPYSVRQRAGKEDIKF